YHPYARLWLPLHALGWLILGHLVVRAMELEPRPSPGRPWRLIALAACLAASFWLDRIARPHPRPLTGLLGTCWDVPGLIESSNALRNGCEAVAKAIISQPKGKIERVRVLARPAVLFYLAPKVPYPMVRESDLGPFLSPPTPGD